MKHSLQLRLSQHLTLTPQLQQSIRLLQLSTLELTQELERILQENPLLEREDGIREQPAPPTDTTSTPAMLPTIATRSRPRPSRVWPRRTAPDRLLKWAVPNWTRPTSAPTNGPRDIDRSPVPDACAAPGLVLTTRTTAA